MFHKKLNIFLFKNINTIVVTLSNFQEHSTTVHCIHRVQMSASTKYAPLEVYKNIRVFIKYRGVETSHKFMEDKEFVAYIKHREYIVVHCTKIGVADPSPFKNLLIVITAPDAKAATKTQDFEKMMNAVGSSVSGVMKTRPEVLIISENPLTNFIMKKITEIKHDNKGDLGEPFIRNQQYDIFKIVVPEHPLVPKQTIMAEEEVKEFEQTFHRSRSDLPKMRLNDPISIWLGARPGQVVKSMRISETVGLAPAYRVVTA